MAEQGKKSLITEGILIFLIPCLVYFTAYLYEGGFCRFFGIPPQFIKVEMHQIILSLSLVFILGFLFLMCHFFWKTIIDSLTYKFNRDFRFLFILPVPTFLFLLILSKRGVPSFVLFLVPAFLASIFEIKFKKPQKVNPNENRTLFNFLFSSYSDFALIVLYVIIILHGIGEWGSLRASKQEEFLVSSLRPDTVILRVYGDNLICAQFNREAKKVKPIFSVLKVTENPSQTLGFESVGPLRLEE